MEPADKPASRYAFTEGFDRCEVKDAKALLDELKE